MDILRFTLHRQGQAALRQCGHGRAGIFSLSGVEGDLRTFGLGGEEKAGRLWRKEKTRG